MHICKIYTTEVFSGMAALEKQGTSVQLPAPLPTLFSHLSPSDWCVMVSHCGLSLDFLSKQLSLFHMFIGDLDSPFGDMSGHFSIFLKLIFRSVNVFWL